MKADLRIIDGSRERTARVRVADSKFRQAELIGVVLAPAPGSTTLNLAVVLESGPVGASKTYLIVIPELDWEYVREWEPSRVLYGDLDDASVYYDFAGELVAAGTDGSQVLLLAADVSGPILGGIVIDVGRIAVRVDRHQFDVAFDALLDVIRDR